eukprot:TRINITY_DN4379_c0_g1_i6.p1 TRINITY_DN4379_c0_g1~~TRINITY_DN4379_c0_g1_i6.p1  ORF type:complete len:299 (-),score=94.52 TRINITY_DN4379_c0_g1_i6:414-1310(-)
MLRSLVGSEMCIRDSINAEYGVLLHREMFSALTSLVSGEPDPPAEQQSENAEQQSENAEQQSENAEQQEGGADLLGSIWEGLTAISETVQSEISAQHEAVNLAMTSNKAADLDGGQVPWHGCSEHVANQILALSEDERPFLQPAPSESKFRFNLDEHAQVAVAVCESDPRLAELRYRLVPDRVSDGHFWRNYFFRIKLIKEMPDLLETADTRAANSPSADKPASVSHQVRESNAAEFVSDEYVETAEAETDAWRKELQEELGLGLDDVNGEDEEDVDIGSDWEADLSAELEGMGEEAL